jgi:UDP-N-acetylglucosamine--N-acetylmuramyl-(pentapeptide) pyrophosphoryl-undecaprenol N-acetylglucosamine transferase
MRGPAVHPIVIAAGGTGGHFFPAEALAAELLARGHRIVLMTDARSGALKSPVFGGQECHVLHGAGIAGRGVLRAAKALFALATGFFQARRILSRLDAAVVIGFGGYPSVAPILAAASLRRRPKCVLHEQNAVLGRANRFLARFSDRLALGFTATSRIPAGVQTAFVGNPVRSGIAALMRAPYTPPAEKIRLLILGGSLGARIFGDVVPSALAALPAPLRSRLQVVQQCRKEDLQRVEGAYRDADIEAELAPFFTDVAAKYVACTMVIARAGASTCAEIAVAGRPAILVPLPGAIDDHQAENARALAEAGAATVMRQADFSSNALTLLLEKFLADPATLQDAADAASRCARPRAAADLADLLENLLAQRENVR